MVCYYLLVFKMNLVKLEAIQLDGEVARVADGDLLLHSKVRHHSTKVNVRLAELKTRLDAFASTHQCSPATAVSNAQHHAAFILPLYTFDHHYICKFFAAKNHKIHSQIAAKKNKFVENMQSQLQQYERAKFIFQM